MPISTVNLLAAAHLAFAAAAKTTTKSSGSTIIFYLLIVLLIGGYLWVRPQRRRMRQQQSTVRQFDVGDEIVTTSGIVGRVHAINGDRVVLEIASGTTIEIMRQAVARRAEPPAYDDPVHAQDDDPDSGPEAPQEGTK